MSDLIKREDAIASIKPMAGEFTDNGFMVDYERVLSILEELPSADRSQGEWIPCSERLPEEREWVGTKLFGTTISENVLVTFESQGKRFVKPMSFQNGELGGMDKHTMDAIYGEWKAVAWMPIPEPWEGAEDDRI